MEDGPNSLKKKELRRGDRSCRQELREEVSFGALPQRRFVRVDATKIHEEGSIYPFGRQLGKNAPQHPPQKAFLPNMASQGLQPRCRVGHQEQCSKWNA